MLVVFGLVGKLIIQILLFLVPCISFRHKIKQFLTQRENTQVAKLLIDHLAWQQNTVGAKDRKKHVSNFFHEARGLFISHVVGISKGKKPLLIQSIFADRCQTNSGLRHIRIIFWPRDTFHLKVWLMDVYMNPGYTVKIKWLCSFPPNKSWLDEI